MEIDCNKVFVSKQVPARYVPRVYLLMGMIAQSVDPVQAYIEIETEQPDYIRYRFECRSRYQPEVGFEFFVALPYPFFEPDRGYHDIGDAAKFVFSQIEKLDRSISPEQVSELRDAPLLEIAESDIDDAADWAEEFLSANLEGELAYACRVYGWDRDDIIAVWEASPGKSLAEVISGLDAKWTVS